MILNLLKSYINDGSIFWKIRIGVIYEPFSAIYGISAVIMIFLLADKNYKWYKLLIFGSLLGGLSEYACSLIQEIFTGMVSWNYS